MKKNLSLLLIIGIISILFGCKGGPKDPHSDNFKCHILYDEKDSIAIAHLSSLYDKDYIFVPKKIDNYIVKKLGFTTLGGHFNLDSQNILKRIYLPNSIEEMQYDFLTHSYDLDFFYCGEVIDLGSEYATLNHIQFFVPNDIYQEFSDSMREPKDNLFKANVTYFLNYDTDNPYYYVDNYEYGSKIIYIPPTPIRDGYKFLGWYKDEACTMEWNFNNDIISLSQEEVYKENRLYAKWGKMYEIKK
ncbi:MAG: InlB B-repeat-containing protein [Anaeroplasma bactoclasticum]|nr:InlB B-repeat-containing protein [Anaeroplasma bactoclasticum]